MNFEYLKLPKLFSWTMKQVYVIYLS